MTKSLQALLAALVLAAGSAAASTDAEVRSTFEKFVQVQNAHDAKALEAMGKISEVLGKRSATVTGEMMVEVESTKQTLKTAFTQQQAKHAEAGGEIHRDEVPLIFQPFVERYFEEIRKTPQAAKPAPAASKSNKKAG